MKVENWRPDTFYHHTIYVSMDSFCWPNLTAILIENLEIDHNLCFACRASGPISSCPIYIACYHNRPTHIARVSVVG